MVSNECTLQSLKCAGNCCWLSSSRCVLKRYFTGKSLLSSLGYFVNDMVKVYLEVLLTTFIGIKPILSSGYVTYSQKNDFTWLLLMTDQKLFLSPRYVTNEVCTNVFFHQNLLLTNIYWRMISTECVANIFSLKYDSWMWTPSEQTLIQVFRRSCRYRESSFTVDRLDNKSRMWPET